MSRVFVYEHITSLGLGREPGSPEHSLFTEGRAMLSAVTADFAAVSGVRVITFPDGVPSDQQSTTFSRLAKSADWSLLIAPETGRVLEQFVTQTLVSCGKLLGPPTQPTFIASDKWLLGALWEHYRIPTPKTFNATEPTRFPVVCKPRDGCGSEKTYLIRNADEWAALPHDANRLVQEYVPGHPVSVAFLVGPNQTVPLMPTFQHLTSDGRFRYLGGSLPIPPELAERAIRLGSQAIGCVPELFGYVGVDLVLGERDVAIELNPRLTTSYVGLRALAETNLAGAMLDVCEGRPVEVKWKSGAITFGADGQIHSPTPAVSPPTPR